MEVIETGDRDTVNQGANSTATVGGPKTLESEIKRLATQVYRADKLVFGERPDKAEGQATPIASRVDSLRQKVSNLISILERVNRALEGV